MNELLWGDFDGLVFSTGVTVLPPVMTIAKLSLKQILLPILNKFHNYDSEKYKNIPLNDISNNPMIARILFFCEYTPDT